MMNNLDFENNSLARLITGTLAFSLFFVLLSLGVGLCLPNQKNGSKEEPVLSFSEMDAEKTENFFNSIDYPEVKVESVKKDDAGLVLYRQPQSRSAVEWFYSGVVNNREVAMAILQAAEEYNIPLSLAFALAHTESGFKTTAMHKNTNGSIDRGLFQLNDQSFPKLAESDFYDPEISAHYGMAHLRFCLNSAGNEIAALAMYNAGSTKVKRNNTPQTTLNYISKIQNYKNSLDENFAVEVLALYNNPQEKILAKK